METLEDQDQSDRFGFDPVVNSADEKEDSDGEGISDMGDGRSDFDGNLAVPWKERTMSRRGTLQTVRMGLVVILLWRERFSTLAKA